MLRRARVSLVVFAIISTISNTTFGWSAGGHRVIARIAWALLDPPERQAIADIIRANPRFSRDFDMPANILPRNSETEVEWLFTQAAVWPDIIRSDPAFHRSTWHYINLPVYLTDSDREALEEELPANLLTDLPGNPENARLNAIQATKLTLAKLKDGDVSASQKGVFICWLFHVAGDLRQPLHSSTLYSRVAFPSRDRGGNLIQTDAGNLHSFWDRLLSRNIQMNTVRQRAVEILRNDMVKPRSKSLVPKYGLTRVLNSAKNSCTAMQYATPLVRGKTDQLRLSDE